MQDKIFKSKILSETNNNPHFVKIICDVAKYILGREKKLSKSEIIAKYTKKLNAVWNTCNIKIKR